MSTRGFVGMIRHGQTLITYNHHDSYPDYLGMKTMLFVRANIGWIDLVAEKFFALTRVDPAEDPTPEQLVQLKACGFDEGWEGMMDVAHGDLGVYLKAGVIPVLSEVPVAKDTVPSDLEWGYLINLDTREVEAYRMLFYAGMEPRTLRIAFDELASCDLEELAAFPETITDELDKDDVDRELGEMVVLHDLIEKAKRNREE